MASSFSPKGSTGQGKRPITGPGRRPLETRKSSFNLLAGKNLPAAQEDETKGKKSKATPATKGTQVVLKARPNPFNGKKGKQTVTARKGAEKVKYDKEATKKFDDMLDGDLADLPPLPRSMVKIFLSSTFSDMRAERNMLAREVYPRLRELYASLGLDFQVVDMRWGVTEDSQNDHSVEALCLQEVKNCQRDSRGPNFVVLSGDRYGFRPIPTELPIEEYQVLRGEATKLNLVNQNLLDDWYKLDTNALPNKYMLQPIRSKFTFFADFSPGCDEPRAKDTASWWETFQNLQEVLRRSAEQAFKHKKISQAQLHQYFLSVTECEIQEGILKASDVGNHCLVYKRGFRNLSESALMDDTAARFIDVTKTATGGVVIDEEVLRLRNDLISSKVASKLPSSNVRTYSVMWRPGGTDPSQHEDHVEYLSGFCCDFISDCTEMVERALKSRGDNLIMMSNYYSHYEETIHHLRFCQAKCDSFCGQEQILDAAKKYILDESIRRPFTIHAESGVGKTSIMAMIMKNIPKWMKNHSHLKLIRFIGTTPLSSNIYDVLFSVLGQLADASDMIMSPMSYRTMKNLIEYFPRFLRQVANTVKEPVVILLDSIDQLDPHWNAYAMEWLPKKLPPNVKIILSTLPEEHGILENIKKIVLGDEYYVEVPMLPESTGKQIIETYMKKSKRTLTDSQLKVLLSTFKKSPSPLFLKLLLDEAKKWKSYTPMSDLNLLPTVKEAIKKLFENLENKFGHLLVSHALGYITAGLGGLTEFEIEDVLSCDDRVLCSVYKYHDPPVPGIVRIPPVLWARIRNDIQEYLVERISQGKNTLNWYHRQFIASAKERYTSDGKDVELHRNLTDIYLQDTGIKRMITLTNRKNLTIDDADRQVTPQPFTVKNHRKLACLAYHAIRAYSMVGAEVAKSKIFCNFNFLYTNIAAFSPSKTLAVLDDFLQMNNDEEVSTLRHFLSVSKDDLTNHVRFAVCLVAQIQPEEHQKHLQVLLQDAREFLQSQKKPLLIPAFPCLAPRHDVSGALDTSIKGFAAVCGSNGNVLLLESADWQDDASEKSKYAIFNSQTQDLQEIDLSDQGKVSQSRFVMNEDKIFYIKKSSVVVYKMKEKSTETIDLSKTIPKWNAKTDVLVDIALDPQQPASCLLILKSSLMLMNLNDMKCCQKFITKKKCTSFTNALFSNIEGTTKIIAIGKEENSATEDTQGPENQSFVCVFEQGTESPLKYIAVQKDICRESMALADNDKWVVMSGTDMADKSESEAPASVLTFMVDPLAAAPEISLQKPVIKIQTHPKLLQAVALTADGCVHFLDIADGKEGFEVELNHPVTDMEVLWDSMIGLLGSSAGKITLCDFKGNTSLGAFSAHSTRIREICLLDQQCVTLGLDFELKSWTIQTLIDEVKREQNQEITEKNTRQMLDETTVTAIAVYQKGQRLITCSSEGSIRVWDIGSQTLWHQYHVGISANVVLVMNNGSAALLDQNTGKMCIMDVESGKQLLTQSDLPSNVLTITTNQEKSIVYVVSQTEKERVQIDIVNIQLLKIAKTIVLMKGLMYEKLTAVLSKNEKYLVLQAHISVEQFNSIKAMWTKGGSFPEQPHKSRFTAVDLSQGNGNLMHCYRMLSKIPTLGVVMEPYEGNTMLITTRRWVVFWDIPANKCDQRTSKDRSGYGMFYRPAWLGQECKGTSQGLAKAPNGEFLAVGSEDGYMFVYDAKEGAPRRKVKPSTKHSSEVHVVAISPNSQWVASSCRGSVLKLWASDTGVEKFSLRVDAEVQSMMFTPDSRTLVLYTGSHTTRVLMFTLHAGKPGDTD